MTDEQITRSPDTAADDAAQAAGATSGTGENNQGETAGTVSMTQAELDRLIAQRVKRAEKAVTERLEAEAAKAQMTEAEKLKAERDEAQKAAKSAVKVANERLLRASAIEALADAGVPSAKRNHALKMLDLTDVEIEDGSPDEGAITQAVKALLADVPELGGQTGVNASAAGTEFAGGQPGRAPLTPEYIAKMPADELKQRWPEVQAWYARQKGR